MQITLFATGRFPGKCILNNGRNYCMNLISQFVIKWFLFYKACFINPFYPGVATTNNAFESFNNVMKRNNTFGVRPSFLH
jgi:hypothetical protein